MPAASPATPRLVVFDLDGTLVDSVADLATAVNRTLHLLSPEAAPLPRDRVRSFIGDGAILLLERSLAAAGLGHIPARDTLEPFLEQYEGCLLDSTLPYPGIEPMLDRLGEAGIALAVLTNKPGAMSRVILDGLGLSDRFGWVLGGGDVPRRKPDPEGLLRIVERAAVRASAARMVGDSAVDVRTGRAAGVPTIGVTWGFDTSRLVTEGPDRLLDDPGQLAEALLDPHESRSDVLG